MSEGRLTLFFLAAGSDGSIPAVFAKTAFPAIREGWIMGPARGADDSGAGEAAWAGASACASEKSTCLRLVDMLVME